MTEKLNAYTVALTFADGPAVLNSLIAPTEIAAVAMAAVATGRIVSGDLVSFSVQLLEPRFMQEALRLIDGGGSASVVSLVSDNLRSPMASGEANRIARRYSRLLHQAEDDPPEEPA